MQATLNAPDARNENRRAALVGYGFQVIDGTLQRADYRKGQLRIIAQGRVWEFVVDAARQLRFDGEPAILRCFHPLDHVEICFEDVDGIHIVRGLQSWAKQALWIPSPGSARSRAMFQLLLNHWATYLYLFWFLVIVIVNLWPRSKRADQQPDHADLAATDNSQIRSENATDCVATQWWPEATEEASAVKEEIHA